MMEATRIPRIIALRTDLQCIIGLRFLNGILERESVSIIIRVQIVSSERRFAVSIFDGNTPLKLVIRAIIIANVIMNELLFKASLTIIGHRHDTKHKRPLSNNI